jgi:hypothetical protein
MEVISVRLSLTSYQGIFRILKIRYRIFSLKLEGQFHFEPHWLTHSLSWALLEKLSIVQLLKNFPAFYETRRFIIVFTRTLHWFLSWARWIQSIPFHPVSLRSILILIAHLRLGLPSGLFPSGFPTNILYAFFFAPFVLHALPISFSLINRSANM